MIKVSIEAQKLLQEADDKAGGLPSPSSRWFGDRLENYCGGCGHHPVEGPDTRYRCPACGRTVDEYPCICQHVAAVDEVEGYPETETALAMLAEVARKAAEGTAISRAEQELALAWATVVARPTGGGVVKGNK